MGLNVSGFRKHPVATLTFAVVWASAWVATVLTWERDAAGYSIGMALSVVPLHFVLPVLLGVVIALRESKSGAAWVKGCALAGMVFGLVQFGILSVVGFLWLPAPEYGPAFKDLVAGTLVSAVVYGAVCAVLGVLGGGLRSAALAAFAQDR